MAVQIVHWIEHPVAQPLAQRNESCRIGNCLQSRSMSSSVDCIRRQTRVLAVRWRMSPRLPRHYHCAFSTIPVVRASTCDKW
jgi:hypothetical protein